MSVVDWKTQKFLQLTFQDYYRNNPDSVDTPAKIKQREFAFESYVYTWRCTERTLKRRWVLSKHTFDERIRIGCGKSGTDIPRGNTCPACGAPGLQWNNWTRHIGIGSHEELVQALVESPPQGAYHSAAFYNVPVAKIMEEKGWLGSELVFDIDADHLKVACTREHDAWFCKNKDCGAMGHGEPPQTCPHCGGSSLAVRKWFCDRCLGVAKSNAIRLHDEFLVNDLGLDPASITLNYSGHRGYHVRVNDAEVNTLNSAARVELVHFIKGIGLDSERLVHLEREAVVIPNRQAPAWAGRIADALIRFIRDIDTYEGTDRWLSVLREERSREILLAGLSRNPPIISGAVKGLGIKSWREIVARAVEQDGVKIDEPVTHDVHRIIRLIGSLNGKTGFLVKKLTRDELDTFDPFVDSIVMTGDLRVRIRPMPLPVPKFKIGDEYYGPYNDETVDLPMAAAVFLLCKGVATIE